MNRPDKNAHHRPWNLLPVLVLALASTACSLFSSPAATCGVDHAFDNAAGVERFSTSLLPVRGASPTDRAELRFDATRRPGESGYTLYLTVVHQAYTWLGVQPDVAGTLTLAPAGQPARSLTAMRVDHEVLPAGTCKAKTCGGDILVEQASYIIDAPLFALLRGSAAVAVTLKGTAGTWEGTFAPGEHPCLGEVVRRIDPGAAKPAAPPPPPETRNKPAPRSRDARHPFKTSGKTTIYP